VSREGGPAWPGGVPPQPGLLDVGEESVIVPSPSPVSSGEVGRGSLDSRTLRSVGAAARILADRLEQLARLWVRFGIQLAVQPVTQLPVDEERRG